MLFSSEKKDDLALILDVQTSLVHASLVHFHKKHKPRVVFSVDGPIPYQTDLVGERLVAETLRATNDVVNQVSKYLHTENPAKTIQTKKVGEVHFVLSSPWISSEAKRLDVTFDKPKIISTDDVLGRVKEEREKMIGNLPTDGKTVAVEEKIFDVEIDGYSIKEWRGKSASKLGINFVISVGGSQMIEKLKDACRVLLRGHNIYFHSCLLLQYIGLSEIYPERDTYTIVHVHGELTDIVNVEMHASTFFASYPIGVATMLRSFSKESGISTGTARSAINLVNSGVLEKGSDNTGEFMNRLNDTWFMNLENALKAGGVVYDGSVRIIVSASDRQNDFVDILKKKLEKARIGSLGIDDITPHVEFDPEPPRRVMTGLFALAIGKFRR